MPKLRRPGPPVSTSHRRFPVFANHQGASQRGLAREPTRPPRVLPASSHVLVRQQNLAPRYLYQCFVHLEAPAAVGVRSGHESAEDAGTSLSLLLIVRLHVDSLSRAAVGAASARTTSS